MNTLERWIKYKNLARRAAEALEALAAFLEDPANEQQEREAERNLNLAEIRGVSYHIRLMQDRAYENEFFVTERMKDMEKAYGKEWWKHGENENHNSGNPSGEE